MAASIPRIKGRWCFGPAVHRSRVGYYIYMRLCVWIDFVADQSVDNYAATVKLLKKYANKQGLQCWLLDVSFPSCILCRLGWRKGAFTRDALITTGSTSEAEEVPTMLNVTPCYLSAPRRNLSENPSSFCALASVRPWSTVKFPYNRLTNTLRLHKLMLHHGTALHFAYRPGIFNRLIIFMTWFSAHRFRTCQMSLLGIS